jgi:UDP-3-O-[3-hydroxymyristoyl] glucosamine N-acyltransferase
MQLGELARELGARLEGDPNLEIRALAPIDEAGPGDLTFVANPRYRRLLDTTRASAVIVATDEEASGPALLRVDNPYGAFVRALALFDDRPRLEPGIHPSAAIAPDVELGTGARVGAYAVIGAGTKIGPEATIHPHVVIYPGVRIGARFLAHAGAVVRERVRIGDDVTLQPGAVLGGDGFGFVPMGQARPVAIPQIGTVDVGDGVDIGANTTVDRAAIGATRLGEGVKLDNLVMVAHGCRVGEGSMLAGQVGMAGSTIVGRRVMAGGQAGFAGHLEVGDGAQIAAQCGVTRDIDAGAVVSGLPAVPIGRWRRMMAALARLPELLARVRELERKVG